MTTAEPGVGRDDSDQLAALGYPSEFRRDITPWANFALGFTYLSPVVGIYTLFAISLATAGPPMFWSLVIVGAVGGPGLLYLALGRPHERSDAAAGDAISTPTTGGPS